MRYNPRMNRASESLVGSIERVTFHNADNGFAVLKTAVKGHRDLVTLVGHLAFVIPGEFVEAEGRWVVDRDHGQQFKADSIRTTHPGSSEGMERYLGSGFVKGIGPHFAAKLVEMFGVKVFEIIDKQPERLTEVHGIGKTRQERIASSWHEQRVVREIMVFLHSYGVGTARAVRIYKTYGDDAIGTVRANPYRLAHDIRGIGFKTADEIAERLGIKRNSPLRAQAGVAYVLMEFTGEGHCAFPEDQLVKKTSELLGLDEGIVRAAVEHEIGEGRLVRDRVGGEIWIYLTALYQAETKLAARMRQLCLSSHPLPKIDIEKALAWVEEKVELQLAPAQRDAISLAATSKVLIITGGPGVGKTTIVDSILRIFSAKNLRCLLSAPTGRAAKRLSEATGHESKTIHRLLEFDPSTYAFKRNADNPLEADVVLIDEVSMMDLPLAHSIIQAVPDHAALILVGDVDQLPSVGPGLVLADLIDSGAVPTIRLTEIFRQAAESQIVQAAHRINSGRIPNLRPPNGQTDFYFVAADEPEAAVEKLLQVVTERIPKRFGFDPVQDIQVLTPMHRGDLGSRNLNQLLQERLNPPASDKSEIQRFGHVYRVGDKVLQTQNDYYKEVLNGDLGIIKAVKVDDSEVHVSFDGRMVNYDFGELDELMPAYAMSIHKSQGSEFPVVVIPIHTQHYMMLQRNLLYTGVTRGKSLVVLVGTTKAIAIAVNRVDARRRYSGLNRRIAAGAALVESIEANQPAS